MRITQVEPHLRAIYNDQKRRDWYPFVINGFYEEITVVDEWLDDQMDEHSFHTRMVFGGRQNQQEKFNLQLAFRSEHDAVAFRLRWASDDYASR